MEKTTPLKPYTISMIGDNDAEINMYGEVVEKRPTNWETGKPASGNFIAMDDFLADLDGLKSKDNITVHINSVGGSLYAGLAIYNRLRALPANVTTINDALAASAASVIFMAGDVRKVNAGSNLMIHGAAGFLFGSYRVADLKAAIKSLESANKTAVAAYAQATGKDAASIKALMDKETWMTGQEAVDAGFADEVIGEDLEIDMSLTPDKRMIVSNGVAMSTCGMETYPAGIKTMTAAQAAIFVGDPAPDPSAPPATQVSANISDIGGQNDMDKITTMEALREAYPDLVDQVEAAAKASEKSEGIKAERARIQAIEAIEAAIGDKEMVREAKYGEKPLTAEQLALMAMKAQAAIGAKVIKDLEDDATESGAAGVAADPVGDPKGDEEQAEADAIEMIASFRPKAKREG